MIRRLRVGWSVAGAVFVAIFPSLASAQIIPTIVPCEGTNCTVCHLAELAQNILNGGIVIAVFLSAILFAWAGWKYVTAAGNVGKAGEAKKVLTNVIIGLVIILAGWLVVDTVMKTLVKQGGDFGPWNEICTSGSGGSPGNASLLI